MNKNTIIIIIVALVVLGGGYMFYSANSMSESALISRGVDAPTEGSEARNQLRMDLLEVLSMLRSIKLDVEFFKNEKFQSLSDFSIELKKEEVGRSNPFLPLGEGKSIKKVEVVETTTVEDTTATSTSEIGRASCRERV